MRKPRVHPATGDATPQSWDLDAATVDRYQADEGLVELYVWETEDKWALAYNVKGSNEHTRWFMWGLGPARPGDTAREAYALIRKILDRMHDELG